MPSIHPALFDRPLAFDPLGQSDISFAGLGMICGNIGSYLQWARPIPLKLVLAVVAGQSRSNSANDLTPACKHSASMALRRASLAKSCSRLNSLPRP
jgi:hypothetical protein